MREYDIDTHLKTVESLKGNNVELFNVHLYQGDNIRNGGLDGIKFPLMCVCTKKEIRNQLKIPLLNIFDIRRRLLFSRKIYRLHKKTNQPDIEVKRSRKALLNSMFNDFYSAYKYRHRFELICKLNEQKQNSIV